MISCLVRGLKRLDKMDPCLRLDACLWNKADPFHTSNDSQQRIERRVESPCPTFSLSWNLYSDSGCGRHGEDEQKGGQTEEGEGDE